MFIFFCLILKKKKKKKSLSFSLRGRSSHFLQGNSFNTFLKKNRFIAHMILNVVYDF